MKNNPLSQDHYSYLNAVLKLQDAKKIQAGKEIADKNQIIKEAEDKLRAFEAMAKDSEVLANISKMQRVLEVLQDDEKRKLYDEALKKGPSAKLEIKGKEQAIGLVPLVKIEDIISEFNAFKNEQLERKNNAGHSLFEESDFSYENIDGPPAGYLFKFADKASADAFIQRLFDKNMAMMSNGSQNINDVQQQSKQQSMKEQLSGLKKTPTPGPLSQPDDEQKQSIHP